MKSGTTWLQFLLDSHPEVICKGEAHFITDIAEPLFDFVNRYNKTIVLKGGMLAKIHHSDNPLQYSRENCLSIVRTTILQMLNNWCHQSDARCVGDKTPGYINHIPLLDELFPDCKFIHIVRDGRDTAVSMWHFILRTDVGKTLAKWGDFSHFLESYASVWKKEVVSGQQNGRLLGENRYLEIRYEDLLVESKSSFAGVLDFLDVDSQSETIQECLNASDFQSLSGGRLPGEENTESFYRKGVSGDWKNHFSEKDEAVFRDLAGDTLIRLGYTC